MAQTLRNGSRKLASPNFVSKLVQNLICDLSWKDFLTGTGIVLALAAVLVTQKIQKFPNYKSGDIAETDIRAPQEMWLEDKAATQTKREEAIAAVPLIFDHDSTLPADVENDIHDAFDRGREILSEAESREGIKLPARLDRRKYNPLWQKVQQDFQDTLSSRVLEVLFQEAFSANLEKQLIRIYRDVQQSGIVQSREAVTPFPPSGIRLRDLQSGVERSLGDSYLLRDVTQARSILRQHQIDLGDIGGAESRELILYLEGKILPNVSINLSETERRRQEAARRVELVQRHIKQGRIIIRQGDEVTAAALNVIEEIRRRNQPREVLSRFIGSFSLIFMLLYAVWRYFNRLQNRHRNIRNHFLLFSLILFLALVTARLFFELSFLLSESLDSASFRDPGNLENAIPFAFGCLLITLLIDTNIAILFQVVFATLVGIYSGNVLLAAYAILGGLAGIYSVKQYRDRSAVLKAGGIIGAVNVFAAVAIVQLTSMTTGMNMLPVKASAGVAGGILAAMLASLLLPVLESLFQITTDIRLLELSNLDRPIMRRMAVEAPGTYHHSIVMGTLAEAAAEAIGANPLQARVASYYHDIGKLSKPAYFVENQAYIPNKHETLTPHMSCLVLASHVKEGLEIAEHLRLPGKIANAIPQHHGTRLMTYFFQKAKSDPRIQEQEVLESSFRYPGPKPQSKETAILMIVDAVEAASRTLSDPTPAQIQGMVKRLIDSIVADGQFDECEITLKDLDLISQSCLKVLCGIFHHRIDYPGYDFTTTDSDAATADTSIHSSIQ